MCSINSHVGVEVVTKNAFVCDACGCETDGLIVDTKRRIIDKDTGREEGVAHKYNFKQTRCNADMKKMRSGVPHVPAQGKKLFANVGQIMTYVARAKKRETAALRMFTHSEHDITPVFMTAVAQFTVNPPWVVGLVDGTIQKLAASSTAARLAWSEFHSCRFLSKLRAAAVGWKHAWHGIMTISNETLNSAARLVGRLRRVIYDAALTTDHRRNAPHRKLYELAALYMVTHAKSSTLHPLGVCELAMCSRVSDKYVSAHRIRNAIARMEKAFGGFEYDSFANTALRFYDRIIGTMAEMKNDKVANNGRLTIKHYFMYTTYVDGTEPHTPFSRVVINALVTSHALKQYIVDRIHAEDPRLTHRPDEIIRHMKAIGDALHRNPTRDKKRTYAAFRKVFLAKLLAVTGSKWVVSVLRGYMHAGVIRKHCAPATYAAAALRLVCPLNVSVDYLVNYFAITATAISLHTKKIKTIVNRHIRTTIPFYRVHRAT